MMEVCGAEQCELPPASQGFCPKHYARFKRHGDADYINPQKTYGGPLHRFMTKVEIVTESGCWIWMGSVDKLGYGRFRNENSKIELAHRFSARFIAGQETAELEVCHRCDTPSCVNPDHLFLGDHKANMDDRDRKGRVRHGESSGTAKLTDEQIRVIRCDTRPTRVVAEAFGVSHGYVSLIRRNMSRSKA